MVTSPELEEQELRDLISEVEDEEDAREALDRAKAQSAIEWGGMDA